MSFVSLTNKKGNKVGNKPNTVRVAFLRPTKLRKLTLRVLIGLEVAKSINLNEADKVVLFHDENNPKSILIKKSLDSKGYKLISKHSPHSFMFQMVWPLKKPSYSSYKLKEVLVEPYEDGLLIHI
jgi:hypothetical protein